MSKPRHPLVQALRDRRLSLGLTACHVDFTRLLGDGTGVGRYECGDRNPTLPKLVDWADALDCDLVLIPRESVDELSNQGGSLIVETEEKNTQHCGCKHPCQS